MLLNHDNQRMKKGQITIKDIARSLNISISTVSRALNDNPSISLDTRRIVQKFAKEHKYNPNSWAQLLRSNQSSIIGVIVPELANIFFSNVLAGIEDIAEKQGYNVIVCQSNENYEKEIRNVETLIKARVSGVISSLSKTTFNYDHFQELIDRNIPIVFFDRICTGIDTSKVVVDDYSGTFSATEYLIKTGCKRIAFFSAPPHLEISKNRKNGYLDALRKNNIAVDERLIYLADTKKKGYFKALEVLQEENRPDGFMTMNDYTASGIILAAKQVGLQIPDDVSICGFSNSKISQDTDPMLTTVDQHPRKVGEEAIELLLEKINSGGKTIIKKNRVVKTSLVVRQSTRPLEGEEILEPIFFFED